MFGIIKNYKYLNVYYCLKEQTYSSYYFSLMRIIKRTKSTYFNRDGMSVLHCAPRSVWPVFTDYQCGREHRSIYSVQMAPTISLNSQCRCSRCSSTRLSESSVNGLLKLLIPSSSLLYRNGSIGELEKFLGLQSRKYVMFSIALIEYRLTDFVIDLRRK